MDKDLALKAIDRAFGSGIARLYDVFVNGLIIGTAPDELTTHFRTGFKNHTDAHKRMTAAIEVYFKDGT